MLEHYGTAALQDPIDGLAYERAGFRRGLFATALADPLFREQGLVGTPLNDGTPAVSPRQIMDFFELTQEQLHEFSCNCGGQLTGATIADRIERLAGPAPVAGGGSPTLLDRAKSLFGR
jgi:hypothetical protein